MSAICKYQAPSSIKEFNDNYFIDVKDDTVLICDRVNQVAIAQLKTEGENKVCVHDGIGIHVHEGMVYFTLVNLKSYKYSTGRRTNCVFKFDGQSIHWIWKALDDAQFIKNLLVEFGYGFRCTGKSKGIITVYDLNSSKVVKQHSVSHENYGGFYGSIDREKEEICVRDVCDRLYTFPLFDKV